MRFKLLLLFSIIIISCTTLSEESIDQITAPRNENLVINLSQYHWSRNNIDQVDFMESIAGSYLRGNYQGVLYSIDLFEFHEMYNDSYDELEEVDLIIIQYIKGLCYLNLGQYSNSLEILLGLENVIPDILLKELYNYIGVIYYYLADYSSANEFFLQALVIDPNYAEASNNISIIEYRDQYAENIFIPYPGIQSIYLAQGWYCYYLGDYMNALHWFKKMVDEDSSSVLGYISVGMTYDTIFNYTEAKKYYLKGLEIEENYPDIWNNLGIVYYSEDDFEQAENCFLKAIELNEFYAYPYNNLAFLYFATGDMELAEVYFQEAIEINNYNQFLLSESYAGLAVIYFLNEDFTTAFKCKEIALSLNSNFMKIDYLEKELRWEGEWADIFYQL